MEYGDVWNVGEPGWRELETHVMRPRRSGDFTRVLEAALALTAFEARLVVQCQGESREDRIARHKRRFADTRDVEEMQRRSREQRARLEMRRSRAPLPAIAWRDLVPTSASSPVERTFAGVVVQKGGTVSPLALHVAWGAWNVESEPTTIDPVLVLAADIEGMRAVESLALETCRRLEKKVTHVTWFVEHEPRLVETFRGASDFRERIDAALGVPRARLAAGEYPTSRAPHHPTGDEWRFEWLRLAKRDVVRRNVWDECAKVLRVGENPLEPTLEIWRRGYAFVDVVGDAVVLAAASPPLDLLLDVLV